MSASIGHALPPRVGSAPWLWLTLPIALLLGVATAAGISWTACAFEHAADGRTTRRR
jgi:hypothetical protein